MFISNDPLEVYVEADTIILRKFTPVCYLCGSSNILKSFKEKRICIDCIDDFNHL